MARKSNKPSARTSRKGKANEPPPAIRRSKTRPSATITGLGLAPPPTQIFRPLIAKTAASALPQAIGAKGANTVIYVHGIGNKPPASVLKCQWDTALFGNPVGDRSRMAYWVDRARYPAPSEGICAEDDSIDEDSEASAIGIKTASAAGTPAGATLLAAEINALAKNPQQKAFLASIAAKMQASAKAAAPAAKTTGPSAASVGGKLIPLPEFLRRPIADRITRIFLQDVHDFLFDAAKRDAMEQTLFDRLAPRGGPFVVIAHSQGSMIAYDVLRRLQKSDADVALFITIGSPLGVQEVQDALKQWTGGTLPFPPCVSRWVNIAERLDPVAADPHLDNDYQGTTTDIVRLFLNPDWFGDPHSATGYLSTAEVRNAVRENVGSSFEQAIAPFAIAKDLVAQIEDGAASTRHNVLVQLAEDRPGKPEAPKNLDSIADAVKRQIGALMKAQGIPTDRAGAERLKHFIVADLTRGEVEALRSNFKTLKIDGIWRNAAKRALVMVSSHTVQARPANLGYGADGRRIAWAVLDTGIRGDHPHFALYKNIVAQWDCTRRGTPVELRPGNRDFGTLDRNGHGTHVAGIIAGEHQVIDADNAEVTLAGMAPRCSLFGFKVLDDEGFGQDSYIIKGLDTIAAMNERAGQLVIHGVNLSLGGNFDPTAFGCGHTPLCQELRRLWRQGVLVCLAAGNEGYVLLRSSDGEIPANLDLTIGDPANLEEAIAVGSVHKSNPHTYGISYFSSRGPTADGRRKPDVVAPGEKIVSARHDWVKPKPAGRIPKMEETCVEMSGTSMATPHVSGLLASFLSLRREFIAYPDRVKTMLIDGCVDLRRDPYFQGAGLPNLIKMLALN